MYSAFPPAQQQYLLKIFNLILTIWETQARKNNSRGCAVSSSLHSMGNCLQQGVAAVLLLSLLNPREHLIQKLYSIAIPVLVPHKCM